MQTEPLEFRSYPFLGIARSTGEDYGLVLSYADLVIKSQGEPFEPSPWERQAARELKLETKMRVARLCALPIEQRHRSHDETSASYCVFCRCNHAGGATCVGHYP